ncbi:ATP-binding cassette domain-containing protein [Pediococcus pentosaceus]|jgi:polar amino acid transport system ATP-binding protein|uniref:ATP-binding cassette domain-containing protein n=2 Tax=Pediococcus pentosaceus TaxID=1255 RepID=A0AAE2UVJ0_PEDPE|nr:MULTISPECIES: ATP-binding cassette domain-containing protein [Pediococcus]ABJ68326.1 amino acid ABC transporter ATP-binding protein, PAAT family [Pediococcus pentosaceus ATCC 25745]ANI97654.1 polar amino acid ABC transporter ATP-binding protein [Pediococcus pentosaceus]ASC08163.1 Heme-transporting ATPase [Pediococcus pentosaceus]AVL01761.1 polar amino acid ABC transporter ATP-binding protein [Pediococcus pentosaceus]AXR43764.1 amino acid ABC transporter ATP-binding protein [Pediococcus pent
MLELKNVVKSFNGKTIINNLNLKIQDGKILTIVGPSGAGKTTLLRCISGLEKIDSGEFLLDGQPFDPYESRDNESVIGVVFQDFQLFPNLSVIDNITLAPINVLHQKETEAKERVQNIIERLDLTKFVEQYPYQLSGGQKQRVAIARALAMNPSILCYDEPTSALDPELRNEVSKLILDLKENGITQVIITHDIEFADKVADDTLTVKPVD